MAHGVPGCYGQTCKTTMSEDVRMGLANVADTSASDRRQERADSTGPRRFGEHVLGAVTLALALGLLWLLARPLALLLAAIILANALEPVADYLMRWMRRTLAIARSRSYPCSSSAMLMTPPALTMKSGA